MARLKPIPLEQMTPEQRQVYDSGVALGRRMWLGPYISYIRNPAYLGLHVQAMTNIFREEPLSARLRQLVVLRTIHHWGAVFPWEAQRQPSIDAGIDPAVIDAIGRDEEPPLTDPKDIAAYRFCSAILEDHRVDNATYEQALQALGEAALSTIVIAMGMISMTSMTCNAFEITSA